MEPTGSTGRRTGRINENGSSRVRPGEDGVQIEIERPVEKKHLLLKDTLLLILQENQTKTGLDKQSLVIKPATLQQGRTYILEVKATHKGKYIQLYSKVAHI